MNARSGNPSDANKGAASEDKLDQILAKLRKLDQLDVLEEKIDRIAKDLKEDVSRVEDKVDALATRVVSLERQVRKRNLLWFGVEEQQDLGKNKTDLASLLDLINNTMGVVCTQEDFEEPVRYGRTQREGVCRPICIEVRSLELKRKILSARQTLSETSIYVKEDLPIEERERRKAWRAANLKETRKRPPTSPLDEKIRQNPRTGNIRHAQKNGAGSSQV
ncbi:Hypothetical protein NTJ_04292 [Nesidiocoris tenuis]|uniref:Uncharacterized protein n=1 Tax=Nesidiocoris tenuis TaxID=355587 RepID=A0ABN7AGT7_9HEMI|nr:Hypothetical protein NTJ_04292 [Nesidiocoris tenuis]